MATEKKHSFVFSLPFFSPTEILENLRKYWKEIPMKYFRMSKMLLKARFFTFRMYRMKKSEDFCNFCKRKSGNLKGEKSPLVK